LIPRERSDQLHTMQEIPDLELLVEEQPGSDRKAYTIRLRARDPQLGLNHLSMGFFKLEDDPSIFLRQLFSDIGRSKPQSQQERRAFVEDIRSKAAFLSERILSSELRRLLAQLRGRVRSLLIQSQDPWVPWEVLCIPEDPGSDTADGPFLCEAFAMTRWLPGISNTLALPLHRIAIVAPRDSNLSNGEAECQDILALAGKERIVIREQARLIDLLAAFSKGEYDGWHFTAHGLYRDNVPDLSSIYLEGEEALTPIYLSGRHRNIGKPHPLIFLNSCSSGQRGISLTDIGGWAPVFLGTGAGACIGTLWPIDDALARDFARVFYASLIAGMPIGEAVLAARQSIRTDDNPTWLAYTAFAHPLATCAPTRAPAARCLSGSVVTPFKKAQRKRAGKPVVNAASILPAVPKPAPESPHMVIELPSPAPRKIEGPLPGEERINEKDETVLVFVPGGELSLGAEGLHPWSEPVRWVRLSPFWIGKLPVTNAQYSRFLAENPACCKPAFWDDPRFNPPQHPVVGLSWEEALDYCQWAGLELPSEAQWEAAARGSDQRPYPWGKKLPTPLHANFDELRGSTTPVGAYPAGAGPYGTLDQTGNVWEWCIDPWSSQAYRQIEEGQSDPVGEGDEAVRSLRGGSWMSPAQDLHAAYRDRGTAKLRFNNQGFRCVQRQT
jgi:formylglycine-generating enzyme required for sulfatase activity